MRVHPGPGTLKVPQSVSSCHGLKLSANLDEKVKQRHLFACQEGASSVIAEELHDREEPAEATHGHSKARRVEYSAETVDIRIVCPSRVPTSRKPADSGVGN